MRYLQALRAALAWIASRIFGHVQWQPPTWICFSSARIRETARYFAADLRRLAIGFVVLASIGGAYVWYKSRPIPHYVTFTVTAPALTEYNDRGISVIHP
ncbi:MAG TPA: hypothetical protein VKE70_13765, partial [Candidatus Solibacter sp.]|nr:hypothetical protein [Candidatus Solibacter sp.]